MAKRNINSSKNKTRLSKRSENIIIIVAVTLILAVCAVLIALALEHGADAPETPTTQNGQVDSDATKYPEYENASKVDTEGGYYDASKTGLGLAVDMEKVAAQIDAYDYKDFAKSDKETDFVVIRVQEYGDIVVALRSDIAPKTVENFKKLVSSGFYKDTIFSKVKKDSLISGGIISKTGESKKTDAIFGEFNRNGFLNELSHVRGVLSMFRSSDYNSATGQFLLRQSSTTDLDGLYAAFGYVLKGMDVVDAISKVEVKRNNTSGEVSFPVTQIVIKDVFFVEPVENTGLACTEKPVDKRENYKVTVVDENGKAISGVSFFLENKVTGERPVYNAYTSATGEANFLIAPANYKVRILAAKGYKYVAVGYSFEEGSKEIKITLQKQS